MSKPLSEMKLAANRANAAKSTGPRTPHGKAKVSTNATKHAFRSRAFHCTPEEQPELDALREDLLREMQPTGPVESEHFSHFLLASWNLRRLDAYESSFLAPRPADPAYNPFNDPETRHALAILNRYRADLKRELARSAREIERLQTKRASLYLSHPATALYVSDRSPCADPFKLARQTQPFNETFESHDRDNLTPNVFDCPSVAQRLVPAVGDINITQLSTNQTHAIADLSHLASVSRDSRDSKMPFVIFETNLGPSVEPDPARMKK